MRMGRWADRSHPWDQRHRRKRRRIRCAMHLLAYFMLSCSRHLTDNHVSEVGMNVQRDFLLLVTLAAATVTPALGQTAAPEAAGGVTQSAASVPDFSGSWSHSAL